MHSLLSFFLSFNIDSFPFISLSFFLKFLQFFFYFSPSPTTTLSFNFLFLFSFFFFIFSSHFFSQSLYFCSFTFFHVFLSFALFFFSFLSHIYLHSVLTTSSHTTIHCFHSFTGDFSFGKKKKLAVPFYKICYSKAERHLHPLGFSCCVWYLRY